LSGKTIFRGVLVNIFGTEYVKAGSEKKNDISQIEKSE